MEIKEQAVINLKDIKKILDDLGLKFWIDGGTLLGAYRDKDFCQDDENDIDICLWAEDDKRVEIIARAKELGFFIHHEWELEIALKKNGSKIDIFFNKRNGDDAYTHLYSGDSIAKYVVIPKRFYESLEPIVFYGEVFNAPSPIEEYLSLKYGDWKTPVHRSVYSCINAEQNKLVRDTYEV